jgi:hypothetical protein
MQGGERRAASTTGRAPPGSILPRSAGEGERAVEYAQPPPGSALSHFLPPREARNCSDDICIGLSQQSDYSVEQSLTTENSKPRPAPLTGKADRPKDGAFYTSSICIPSATLRIGSMTAKLPSSRTSTFSPCRSSTISRPSVKP